MMLTPWVIGSVVSPGVGPNPVGFWLLAVEERVLPQNIVDAANEVFKDVVAHRELNHYKGKFNGHAAWDKAYKAFQDVLDEPIASETVCKSRLEIFQSPDRLLVLWAASGVVDTQDCVRFIEAINDLRPVGTVCSSSRIETFSYGETFCDHHRASPCPHIASETPSIF